MKHYVGKEVLITTQAWFHRPDGTQARAVWGTLKAVHTTQEALGFTPSRTHTNWVIEIGEMMITGCQIQYITLCPEPPNFGKVLDYSTEGGVYKEFEKPSPIYNANGQED